MKTMSRAIILAGIFALMVTAEALGQSPNQGSTTGELQKLQNQLEEMRSQMAKMQNRITELDATKENAPTSGSIQAPAQALRSQQAAAKNAEEPMAFHYKGLTLTPGGFFEATSIVRTRNENADVATAYSTIPLNGSSNAKLSEFRGSVRHTRLSLMLEGTAGKTKLKGYVETDFLGAAPTANYVESSSFTPRLRQAWIQFGEPNGWTVTAGQMYSLLTTNRQGIAPLAELIPGVPDANYIVGFTWTRERAARFAKNFNNKVWAAFALEDPESTYSAAFVPPNVMGLNTSPNAATGVNLLPFLPNYSNGNSTTLAPDLAAKVVFEPGWGHFEIKTLGRFFRDRIASTATTTGHTNTTEGYGVGFGALMPFLNKNLEVSLEGFAGQGIGRYGASGLPDVTLNPKTGEMRPLRAARIMGGVVYHRGSRLDLFAYGGDEYTRRYAYVSPTGTAAGYGSPLVSYAGCTNEVALNSCNGANRNIYEASLGYWYHVRRGEHGRFQYGNQIMYIHRNLWSGVGRAPQGGDIVVYSTLRFYLP